MVSLTELPEEQIGDLGKCIICPKWGFTSVTEQDRHRKVFHPKSKGVEVVRSGSQIHTCNYRVTFVYLKLVICCGSINPYWDTNEKEVKPPGNRALR